MNDISLKIIRAKHYKKLNLRLKTPNLATITAPFWAKKDECESFFRENYAWLKECQKRLKARSGTELRALLKEDEIFYFGQWRAFPNEKIAIAWRDFLRILELEEFAELSELKSDLPNNKKLDSTKKQKDKLTPNLFSPNINLKAATHRALIDFYHQNLNEFLKERVRFWCEKMEQSPQKVRIGKSHTRFGSCNAKGGLVFSLILALMPLCAIDSVIIHELAHLAHFDHSPRFWEFVGRFDPAPNEHKEWLNANKTLCVGIFESITK